MSVHREGATAPRRTAGRRAGGADRGLEPWLAVLASIGYEVRTVRLDRGPTAAHLTTAVHALHGGGPDARAMPGANGSEKCERVPATATAGPLVARGGNGPLRDAERFAPFFARVHPEDAGVARAFLYDLRELDGGGVRSYRLRLFDREVGGYRWRDARVALDPDAAAAGRRRFLLATRIYPEGLRPEHEPPQTNAAGRRRELQLELRRSAALFEAIFRHSPAAALLIGRDGRILDANGAFEALTGRAARDVIGRDEAALDLWLGRSELHRLRSVERGDGAFANLEITLRAADGTRRALRVSGVRVPEGRREVRLRMLHDVTDDQRSRRELIDAIQAVLTDDRQFALAVADRVRRVRTGRDYAEQLASLSKRERAVLQALAAGAGTDAISNTLQLSRHTVRNYISSIYGKLGVHSRAAAIIWARESGIAGA